MKYEIVQAFERASQGFSPDRVVADPDLNRAYLYECNRLGLNQDPPTLNRTLLNLRKRGGLRGLGSRRTVVKYRPDYHFAAEIAARYLERQKEITLDQIICDPALADEFDEIAKSIAPGGASLEYRWAALSLRKRQMLQPELLSRISPPLDVLRFKVLGLSLEMVPRSPGLYLFHSDHATLYIGECDNLQNRIRKHLDHSDNKKLAHWMWEFGEDSLHVELQILDRSITQRVRRALELELIRSRVPIFNIKR